MDRGRFEDRSWDNGGGAGGWSMQMVPPPKKAPIQEHAAELGLCAGLRVEKSRGSQWRCDECNQMQKPDSWQVWVPDGVRKSDPEWSITEAARQNAYNGHLSAWCLKCAPKKDRALFSSPPGEIVLDGSSSYTSGGMIAAFVALGLAICVLLVAGLR